MLATELYRAMRTVEEIKKKLEETGLHPSIRGELEDQLRVARAERDRIKALMEGAKAS
ncbi:MAG TPA: hypothetical protein PLM79_04545 [Syntrophobacteraceae bacterium]|jgi:hypothetical protein|nr:hypothetical protein [Syntrophobacteraceae bacterium]